MHFSIQGKKIDLKVTSIILEYDPKLVKDDSPDGLILWHCPIDNTPLFQYSGKMVMVIPGMVPVKLPVIKECPKCKTKYLVVAMI
jgi:hypothetical protein